jgi:hypothetical protein
MEGAPGASRRDAKSSLRARAVRLIEYADFTPPASQNPFAPISNSPQLMLKGHKWMLLHHMELAAQGKWRKIEELTEKENIFQRSLLKNGSLLEIIIAHLILAENARFLKTEVGNNPKVRIREATVKSFDFPQPLELMSQALRHELYVSNYLMNELNVQDIYYSSVLGFGFAAKNRWLSHIPKSWFMKPNQAVNKYYLFGRQLLSGECLERKCFEIYKWSHPNWPTAWLSNPFGRLMMSILPAQVEGRYKSIEKRDKELRENLEFLRKRIG